MASTRPGLGSCTRCTDAAPKHSSTTASQQPPGGSSPTMQAASRKERTSRRAGCLVAANHDCVWRTAAAAGSSMNCARRDYPPGENLCGRGDVDHPPSDHRRQLSPSLSVQNVPICAPPVGSTDQPTSAQIGGTGAAIMTGAVTERGAKATLSRNEIAEYEHRRMVRDRLAYAFRSAGCEHPLGAGRSREGQLAADRRLQAAVRAARRPLPRSARRRIKRSRRASAALAS